MTTNDVTTQVLTYTVVEAKLPSVGTALLNAAKPKKGQ